MEVNGAGTEQYAKWYDFESLGSDSTERGVGRSPQEHVSIMNTLSTAGHIANVFSPELKVLIGVGITLSTLFSGDLGTLGVGIKTMATGAAWCAADYATLGGMRTARLGWSIAGIIKDGCIDRMRVG
ncbi:MAG: hypothetical protein R3C68_04770 [Myxococcota bacterium]